MPAVVQHAGDVADDGAGHDFGRLARTERGVAVAVHSKLLRIAVEPIDAARRAWRQRERQLDARLAERPVHVRQRAEVDAVGGTGGRGFADAALRRRDHVQGIDVYAHALVLLELAERAGWIRVRTRERDRRR